MNCHEIRTQYPHSWLLVEAFDAHTENGQRIIPHLELIAVFNQDWDATWERYQSLHRADKNREYYILHSDREALDIGVIDAFGQVLG